MRNNTIVVHIGHKKDTYNEFEFGSNNNLVVDKICALLLSLSPILQHYIGIYKNAGFTVFILVLPILFLRLLAKMSSGKVNLGGIKWITPIFLFSFYAVFKDSFSIGNVLYRLCIVFIYFVIVVGGVNSRYIMKYAVNICKIACVFIILQFVLYSLFGYHLRLIPVNLLLEGSDMWIERVYYGISPGERYRPSGIFLEPSHFFLYSFPVMAILLLSPKLEKDRLYTVCLISIAMICTTSGMGVLVVVALWAVYLILYVNRKTKKLNLKQILSLRTILLIIVGLVIVVFVYHYVPIINETINRILINEAGQSLAIDGRVRLANMLISKMSKKEIFFGTSVVSDSIDFNLSGFHSTLYRFGVIGIILTYWFYGRGLFVLEGGFFYMTIIILIVSFFSAHTHGTFYMFYYALFLMNGYCTRSKRSYYGGKQNEA